MTACFACSSIMLSGCDTKSVVVNPSKPQESRCDELVANALEMMQPTRLGITSNAEAAVGVLTQWSLICGTPQGSDQTVSPEVETLLKGLVSSEELQSTGNRDFSKRDVEHIRECLLYKAMVDSALRRADADLGRSVELFYYVIRNIALLADDVQTVPLTPYEVILLGRGSAEDRAWIFANLLRQLRIEAVILRPNRDEAQPKSEPETQSSHWLVGVLLDDEVYLFDTKLGLPIPSLKDDRRNTTVQTPASLSEVLKSEEVFRKLDISSEQPYPLKGDEFRNPRVELVGNRSFWVQRMKRLQIALSGEAVLIFDGLDDGDIGDGLVSRIAGLGGERWNRKNLAIWLYPEKTMQSSLGLQSSQRQRHRELFRPFGAPVNLQFDEKKKRPAVDPNNNQPLFEKPSRELLKARTDQITGQYGKVISRYQLLRQELYLPPGIPLPQQIRLIHLRAEEDAFFWTGTSQVEQEEFAAASETLQKYRLRYGVQGAWVNHAGYLLALSSAENEKFAVALQILSLELERESVDLFQRHGYHFLINRWRELRELKQNEPSKSNE